jgi:quinoprotein glucose dehydrogenase
LIAAATLTLPAHSQDADWPTYGGDAGGQRYSKAQQINRKNVARLREVWVYHTHALDTRVSGSSTASFETTPVLFHGLLYLTSPFDEITALSPLTGKQIWQYRPAIAPLNEDDINTSRGVATWEGSAIGPCSTRIFIGTNDGQLISVDAASGNPCEDFGKHGAVDLKASFSGRARDFHVTSAPTIVGNVVVVGSSIPDNVAVDMPIGVVRAFDTRTGRPLWSWNPIPWADHTTPTTGAGNVWSTIAADPALGLLYLPTGSASPDYYGGERPGNNQDADSIVALDATTGRKVWSFQVVHHNLWDYDVPSEPLLFTWHGNIPAVAVTTKMGMIFVLDRRTGIPLFPYEEKPVTKSEVEGEHSSLSQPFSSVTSLSPLVMETQGISASRNDADAAICREQLSGLRYNGIYTPPSIRGSLVFPGAIGGVNWGSAALDPSSGVLYANTNRLPYLVQLIERPSVVKILPILFGLTFVLLLTVIFALESRSRKVRVLSIACFFFVAAAMAFGLQQHFAIQKFQSNSGRSPHETPQISRWPSFGDDHSPQLLAPYSLFRHPIIDSHGHSCAPEPWGTVTAINLQTGKLAWEVPHGTEIAGHHTGAASLGGVIVTAGGLVFSAGTREPVIRAYDADTGKELWQGNLPVPAQATPMTFQINGRQFVVIAAGGHGLWGTPQGDSVVAFALKKL